MKYYKDNQNNVFSYDESQDELIGDKVAMTDEEIEAHINPPIVITIPQSITRVQAMKVMKSMNLWESFKTILANNVDAKDEWELATELERNNEFVLALIPLLNITSSELDGIFVEASKL